jgi:hypothetical protein
LLAERSKSAGERSEVGWAGLLGRVVCSTLML